MKKLTTLLFVLFTFSVFAQKIEVKDIKHKFLSGQKFALSVNIHSDDRKDISKAFKKKAGNESGTVVEKKGEIFMDNAIIPEISSDKIDLFVAIDRHKDGTAHLIVCFEVNNNYIVPKSKEYKKAVKFMEGLSKEISIVVIEKEVAKEERGLNKIVEKITALNNKNKSLEDDSKKRTSRIEENKGNLKNVSADLKDVTRDINSGKGKLDKLTSQKEKLDGKYDKLTDKISRDEQAIRDNERKTEKNKREVEDLEREKTSQEKEVVKAKEKLAKVKK